MCGRYNFTDEQLDEIKEIIKETSKKLLMGETIHIGEIRPTNLAPVLLPDGAHPMTWGYPHFKGSGVIINARAETATEKKMFRESVLERRCIIPSTGFYEWKAEDGHKVKYIFHRPDEKVLYMAGFYGSFREKDGSQRKRYVILTTAANDWMREVHDRMPVVLRREECSQWLSNQVDFTRIFNREHVMLEKEIA